MKWSQEQQQQLQETLRAAYRQREAAPVEFAPTWQTDLMRNIRQIGPLNRTERVWQEFGSVAWHFSAAACTFVVMLAAYWMWNSGNPLDEAVALYFNDPVQFTVAQVFENYETNQ